VVRLDFTESDFATLLKTGSDAQPADPAKSVSVQ
jgi:hypothetical protein